MAAAQPVGRPEAAPAVTVGALLTFAVTPSGLVPADGQADRELTPLEKEFRDPRTAEAMARAAQVLAAAAEQAARIWSDLAALGAGEG